MKTTTEYTISEKLEALRNHLIENEGFTAEEVEDLTYEENWETFCISGYEYKVFTDSEADDETFESINESLWAFNADFILQHTEFYKHSNRWEDEQFVKAIQELQQSLCESANPIVRALIADMQKFIWDAISADGRGHFLSTYDGDEIESDDGRFYIYRIN